MKRPTNCILFSKNEMCRVILGILVVYLLCLSSCSSKVNPLTQGRWEGIVELAGQQVFMYVDGQGDHWKVSFPELMISQVQIHDVKSVGGKFFFSVWLGNDDLRIEFEWNGTFFEGKALFKNILGKAELHKGRYSLVYRQSIRSERVGEDVSVSTAHGQLHGTLLLPEGQGPFICVLLIAGSGPTDRDGNSEIMVGSNDMLLQLALYLQANGFASLRYDKQGVGESRTQDTPPPGYDFQDSVDDAITWIEFLNQRTDIAATGLVGHSEGSLIALASAQQINVDFIVSLAGNGDSIDLQLMKQIGRFSQETALVLKQQLERLKNDLEVTLSGNLLVDSLLPPENLCYLRSWMEYDPVEIIASLSSPLLIVWGTADERITEEDNILLYKGNPAATYLVIEGMGHLLKQSNTPESIQQTYSNPKLPLDPTMLAGLSNFLLSYKGL